MRLTILVTHLLGTGHLARAIAIADAAAAAGHETRVISGGPPAPHLGPQRATLIQLPPVRSDGVDFRTLLTPEGAPAEAAYRARRVDALIAALEAAPPDALVTELFPFGRRVLADEFEAALGRALSLPGPPKIFASIRDVLAPPSTPKKAAQTEARLARFYDGVLVHGDPGITPLDASWPASPVLLEAVRYTGFVAPSPAPRVAEGDGKDEILVSAGGGPVGEKLFQAAVAASADPRLRGRRWRLLVGGADRTARIAALRAAAPADAALIVEGVRPDFRAMLGRAALSVNQAGYNTMLDIAAAGVRSVVVPFEEGGETEQRQRAEAFSTRYGYAVLAEAELSGARLAAAAAQALAAPAPAIGPPDLGGAAASVRELERAVAEGRS